MFGLNFYNVSFMALIAILQGLIDEENTPCEVCRRRRACWNLRKFCFDVLIKQTTCGISMHIRKCKRWSIGVKIIGTTRGMIWMVVSWFCLLWFLMFGTGILSVVFVFWKWFQYDTRREEFTEATLVYIVVSIFVIEHVTPQFQLTSECMTCKRWYKDNKSQATTRLRLFNGIRNWFKS